MKNFSLLFKKFGQRTILVNWPNKVSEEILSDIISFKDALQTSLGSNFEYIPAYNSLTIIDNNKKPELQKLEKKIVSLYSKNINTKKKTKTL